MKIDAFPHIIPQAYFDKGREIGNSAGRDQLANHISRPALYDLNARFQIMDRYENYRQVLTLAMPPIEEVADGAIATELSHVANDSMAELVDKHPDHFIGFAAALSLHDVDAALTELDRAVNQLGALGVQIFTNMNGFPMDEPRFEPLFARMAALNRTIWVHPHRPATVPDYRGEDRSKYNLNSAFGWPYETALFVSRLILSGIIDRNPGLRVLTHHAGGMIPHFSGRIEEQLEGGIRETRREAEAHGWLQGPIVDYYKRFYGDTAISGAPHALACATEFFGVDHILFGTDMPYGSQQGESFIRKAIIDVEALPVGLAERESVYEGNARRLLGLSQ